MTDELKPVKEMGVIQRIIGIFTTPKETFESIDRKPEWLIPFIIIIVLTIAMQLLTMDIGIKDQITNMEARGMSQERLDATKAQINSPFKYIGLIMAPIGILIAWAVIGGVFLLAGNLMIGAGGTFKKLFSMISWTSMLGLISIPLSTWLILSKGTTRGVSMDLSILLPSVAPGESQTFMHLLLARFDLFTIWQLILWTIGLSVFYKTTISKAAIPVITIWIIYCVLAISLTNMLAPFIGM